MINKRLTKILAIQDSIFREREFLKKHPEKKKIIEIKIKVRESKIMRILKEAKIIDEGGEMIHKDTEIRHIAEEVLDSMSIYDVKDLIEEYGDLKQIEKLNKLGDE